MKDRKYIPMLKIENARLLPRPFMNFSGQERKYNDEGDRNFCVVIDEAEQAQRLLEDGWNVRILEPRNEEEQPLSYLQVEVSFSHVPPKVFTVTKRTDTRLDESTIGELDSANIRTVDLTINPYLWDVGGRTGVKAYLRSMYVTLEEDELEEKYAALRASAKI